MVKCPKADFIGCRRFAHCHLVCCVHESHFNSMQTLCRVFLATRLGRLCEAVRATERLVQFQTSRPRTSRKDCYRWCCPFTLNLYQSSVCPDTSFESLCIRSKCSIFSLEIGLERRKSDGHFDRYTTNTCNRYSKEEANVPQSKPHTHTQGLLTSSMRWKQPVYFSPFSRPSIITQDMQACNPSSKVTICCTLFTLHIIESQFLNVSFWERCNAHDTGKNSVYRLAAVYVTIISLVYILKSLWMKIHFQFESILPERELQSIVLQSFPQHFDTFQLLWS